MGISRITAFMIQGNDTRPEASLCKDGKYQGFINEWKDGSIHTTLLSSNESAFNSKEEALKSIQDIIDVVNNTDLNSL